ncbi:MAG: hypothetical protein ACFB4I_17890 [Cyanophyceae cyanobacterium]
MNSNEERLSRIERLVESNARTIEALAEDRRRIDAQLARTDQQIAQLARNQGARFELVQKLSEVRVTLAENLASIAQSLAKLADSSAS